MRFRSLVRAAVIAIVVLGCAPVFAPGPDPSTPPPPSIYVNAPEIVVQVRNQTSSTYTFFMRAGAAGGPWRNLGTVPPRSVTHLFIPRYLLQIDDQFAFRALGGQRIQYFVTPPLKVDVPAIVLLLQQPKVPPTQMRI